MGAEDALTPGMDTTRRVVFSENIALEEPRKVEENIEAPRKVFLVEEKTAVNNNKDMLVMKNNKSVSTNPRKQR